MEAEAALDQIRRRRGVRETAIADAVDASLAAQDDCLYLSTLSRYVGELGGRLELRAVFPDETIVLPR